MIDLSYRERGQGPTLLLIHGLFGSADNLGGLARILEAEFRTISVDLRNHGRSPHADSMSYPLMADDVLRLMDRLGIEKANIFGHSMGGKTAMQLTLDYPDRVKKLIVADIAPVTYSHHHLKILQGMEAVAVVAPTSRKAALEILSKYEDEPAVLSFLLTNWRRGEAGSWEWRINLEAINRDYAKIAVGNTGNPYLGDVLFLRGSNSSYILAEHKDAILNLFPNATVRTIGGTGHWLHAEKPDMVARSISRFLMP